MLVNGVTSNNEDDGGSESSGSVHRMISLTLMEGKLSLSTLVVLRFPWSIKCKLIFCLSFTYFEFYLL